MHIEKRLRINWEGSLFVHHSLGMVNREMLLALAENPAFDIRHIPFEPDQFRPSADTRLGPLLTIGNDPFTHADIHVRHRWPPLLERPSCSLFILFQPWEYGSVPAEWLERCDDIDQWWVYTNYLKECYSISGIPESKIRVIPLGVDTESFNPSCQPLEPMRRLCEGRFVFLYNGGITLRKGADILVNAYLNEFGPDEPVVLFIKGSDAYRRELAGRIAALAERSDTARIIYFDRNLDPNELPGMSRAADCYVQPYRAEGFGLPVAEAMACGLPVIVTGAGACRDFTNESVAYPIACRTEVLNRKDIDGIPTAGYPFWTVPDIDDLRRLMRHVYLNRDEAREKGRAAEREMKRHTWKRSASIVASCLWEQ